MEVRLTDDQVWELENLTYWVAFTRKENRVQELATYYGYLHELDKEPVMMLIMIQKDLAILLLEELKDVLVNYLETPFWVCSKATTLRELGIRLTNRLNEEE